MHLSHEAVLADSKRVRKDDIRSREESRMERHVWWWPHGPVDAAQPASALMSLDASGYDRDPNSEEDRHKVDISYWVISINPNVRTTIQVPRMANSANVGGRATTNL